MFPSRSFVTNQSFLSLSLSFSLFHSVCVCLSVFLLILYVCPALSVIQAFLCMSVCLFLSLSFSLSLSLSIYLSLPSSLQQRWLIDYTLQCSTACWPKLFN